MRIIGGIAGGISLVCPKGGRIRPTSDRVKESLFATLGDIRGWRVVDLFAGTGSLGIEALSRGAAAVVFVERDRGALAGIRRNLDEVRGRFPDEFDAVDIRVLRADVRRVPGLLSPSGEAPDLVLADPPYRPASGEWGGGDLLGDPDIANWAGEALLAVEHDVRPPLAWYPHTPWTLIRQRRFGSTVLSFARTAVQGGEAMGEGAA